MKLTATILLLFLSSLLPAQSGDPDLDRIKSLAAQNRFEEALHLCDSMYQLQPINRDYPIYAARILIWMDRPDSSLQLLTPLLPDALPGSEEKELEIRLMYALKKYSEADSLSHLFLQVKPGHEIQTTRLLCLYQLKEYRKADSLAQTLEQSGQIKAIRRDMEKMVYRNMFRSSVSYESFSSTLSPWKTLQAELMFQPGKHRYTGRVLGVERFERQDFQMEAEGFFILSPKWAVQTNLGLSSRKILPGWLAGAEVYRILGQRSEASLGYQHLAFQAAPTHVITGQYGIYPGNYWFSVRGYLIPQGNKANPSLLFFARRYFRTSEEYIGIMTGYGAFIPQQFTFLENNRLEAWRLNIQGQWRVRPRTYVTGLAGWALEDYQFQQNIHRYSFQLGFFYRFK